MNNMSESLCISLIQVELCIAILLMSYIHIRLQTIQCCRFYATDLSTPTVNFEAFRKASLSTLHTPLSALYGSKLTFAGGGVAIKALIYRS